MNTCWFNLPDVPQSCNGNQLSTKLTVRVCQATIRELKQYSAVQLEVFLADEFSGNAKEILLSLLLQTCCLYMLLDNQYHKQVPSVSADINTHFF